MNRPVLLPHLGCCPSHRQLSSFTGYCHCALVWF